MEGLLTKKENLSKDQVVAPQLLVYEVTNAIWKQDCLLKNIDNGQTYLEFFYGLIDSGRIEILPTNEKLIQESYSMAKRNRIAVYDSIFVCLAIELGLNLRTLDKKQAEIFETQKAKQKEGC